MSTPGSAAGERGDLVQSLDRQRQFLRYTTRGLTDEQAAQRTTASELSLGGLIKHVTLVERQWVNFILEGPSAMGGRDEASMTAWMSAFRMEEGDTLARLLEAYEEVARRTDDLVAALPGPGPWSGARDPAEPTVHAAEPTVQAAPHRQEITIRSGVLSVDHRPDHLAAGFPVRSPVGAEAFDQQ